jgi:hypothetical protein
MDGLSARDLMWLRRDTDNGVGHAGITMLFAPEAGVVLGAAEMREQVAERLPLIPPLRRMIVSDDAAPTGHRWADTSVDLDQHVFEHQLSGAGDHVELGAAAARLNATSLDHGRPLWEIHVIRGLADGTVAALIKLHHATGDGAVYAVAVETLFDHPAGDEQGFLPTGQAPEPSGWDGRGEDVVLPSGPETVFNRPLSAERGFAFCSIAMERFQAIKKAAGTTFTETLIALWGGALRGWLALRGEMHDTPLVARVPISTRTAGDSVEAGNQLAMILVPVPTHLPDFPARAEAARGSVQLARQRPPLPGARGGRMNLSLSTMIGARPPMSWRGVPMFAAFSLAMLTSVGLSLACITRGDAIMVGVHVDSTHVPDPWTIVRAFEAALDDAEAS